MALSWFVLKFLYPNQPRLRVMGLYGCTHKSVATGIPLIDAIYGTYRAVGLYTLPVLVWHPMQLLLGTILSPYLARWVLAEQKRLNLNDRDIPLTSILSEDADDDENANQPPTTTNIVVDEEQQQRQDEVEEQPQPVPKISLIHEKDQ